MPNRRTRGDGGLIQRHDHPTCPPLETIGHDDNGKPIKTRAKHSCKGRWVGTVPVAGGKRKSVYARTQKEAREKLNTAIRERDAGLLVLNTMTVAGWLNHWLNDVAELKPQTRRGYQSKIDQYLVPRLGKKRLTELRPEHIRDLHKWMRGEGKADSTVRQTHAILKKALKDAVIDGKLAQSPADRVKSPKAEKNRRQGYALEDARRVLTAAGDDARWWLALFYGMRQGECLGLDWRHVDFTNRTLTIAQTLQVGADGSLSFGTPKSQASRRTLPLVPLMEARLRLLWETEGRPTEGLVFHNGDGGPIQPKRDWRNWRDLIDKTTTPPLAPLPYIELHAARNSAASLMEAVGIQDRMVMQILGHSQVQITHGYQTAELARMREALEDMSQVVLELD